MIVVVEPRWTGIAYLRTSRRIVAHIAGDTRRAYVSVVIVLTAAHRVQAILPWVVAL